MLSFSWASKQQMQDQLRSEQGGQDGHYAGPGILRVDGQHQDAFVLLAVHNRGPWEIARFRATLKLSGDGRIALKCDRNPFPFFWPHPFTTGTEEIRVCEQPESIATEALVTAVQQARLKGPPNVQLKEFELTNPYVRVTDDADGGTSRFTLYPVDFPVEAPFSPRSNFDLLRELKKTSCESTDTCPSWGQAASLAFYDFFGRHILLLPFLVGLFMGVGMGGFVASFRLAGIVAAVLAVGTVGAIALAFQIASNGPPGESRGWTLFGLMALSVYAITGLLLWIPGLFLGFALTKWVRGLDK